MNPDIVFPLLFVGLGVLVFTVLRLVPSGPRPEGAESRGWRWRRRGGVTTIRGSTGDVQWTARLNPRRVSVSELSRRPWTTLTVAAPPMPGHATLVASSSMAAVLPIAPGGLVGRLLMRWMLGPKSVLLRGAVELEPPEGAAHRLSAYTNQPECRAFSDAAWDFMASRPDLIVIRWPEELELRVGRLLIEAGEIEALVSAGLRLIGSSSPSGPDPEG